MRAIVGLLLAALWPGAALAQPTAEASRLASWDLSGAFAFVAGRPDLDVTDRYYDRWYETAQVGAIVGRHVTRHLKLEFEASTSAEARQYVLRLVNIPIVPHQVAVGAERHTTLHQVSGLVTWQFFENEWVHPFLQIGGGADIERVRWDSLPTFVYSGDPRVPGSTVTVERPAPEKSTAARLLLGGGAKFYVTPRAFFRTDVRFGGGADGRHVGLRLGFGTDF